MALNYVTFNQDNTIVGVATTKGFRLYTTEPFAAYYENEEGDVSIMEMLFSTSLVALILSPRLLRILNTKKNTTIVELTFPMKVLAVRMNRKRLAVVLDESIYLYDISNMKLLQTIETSPNPHALCALSPSNEANFMAYPKPVKSSSSSYPSPAHAPPGGTNLPPSTGEVLIYDADRLESSNVIQAHQSTLSCLSINNSGTMLATASEKGTVIRVFSIPDGNKLFHFRRGTLPAQIYCMTFNATSSLLCVSSATDTIHIFKLVAQSKRGIKGDSAIADASSPPTTPFSESKGRPRPRSESFGSYRDRSQSPSSDFDAAGTPTESTPSKETQQPSASPSGEQRGSTFASMIRKTSQTVGLSLAQRVGGYLPSSVTEMFDPQRDFAWVKVQSSGSRLRAGSLVSAAGGATSMVSGIAAAAGTAVSAAAGGGSSGGGGSVGGPGSPMGNAPGGGGSSGSTGQPVKSVVAMSSGHPQLMVVTSDGQFLVYNIDLERGGEGVLERRHSVLSRRRTSIATPIDDN